MRRYFFDAKLGAPVRANVALAYFRRLYLIERELKGRPADERLSVRRSTCLPLLAEFKEWIDEQAQSALPASDIGRALRYAQNHWEAFVRYCDEGWLIIDNTRSERALRTIVVGRHNWLFYGSDAGGRTGAILSTLVGSAKANQVSTYAYLKDVFERLPCVRQHASLLPLLVSACERVRLPDGTAPNMAPLEDPIDYLRVLKDYPRVLVDQMQRQSLPDDLAAELDSLLPDRWLQAHPEHFLPINRRTRLVGDSDVA